MGGIICKQPNGKYCRYSSIVETVTDINMTFEDYVKVLMRRGYQEWKAREEAEDVFKNWIYPYEECNISLNNETRRSRAELRRKMKDPNGEYEKN